MLYKTNRKLPWILALNDRQLRKPSMVISDALSWATFKLDLEVDISNFEFSTQLWPMKHPHQLTFSASVGLHFSSTLLKQHKPNYTRCYIWFSQFLFSHGAYDLWTRDAKRFECLQTKGLQLEAQFSESTKHLPSTTQARISSQKFWPFPRSVCRQVHNST